MSVYLIGAGCGEGAISLKGHRILCECDCVIYDDLIDAELLRSCKASCEKIYVGKREGNHSLPQEQINSTLVDCARRYPLTVRLKGGDPFVFGRGGEELEALARAGMDAVVVPGVSSATAALAYAGIPVTHRGVARSFHVYTAHTKDGTMPDFSTISRTEGTHVFLMGHSRLKQIVKGLIDGGMDEKMPCVVVSNGGHASQKTVFGRLDDIVNRASDTVPPSVFAVGEVCALFPPKKRFRAAVAGTVEFTRKVCSYLRPYGIEAEQWNLFDVRPLDLTDFFMRLDEFDTLAFTSANGVRTFFGQAKGLIDFRRFGQKKFAAVGSGTAEAIGKYGFTADIVCREGNVKALANQLETMGHVAFLQAENGAAAGGYESFPVYRLQLDEKTAAHCRNRLNEIDVLALSSPSAVRALFGGTGKESGREEKTEQNDVRCRAKIVCIGARTEQAVKEAGYSAWVAGEASAKALAGEIIKCRDCAD